jgi:hypothetical protein
MLSSGFFFLMSLTVVIHYYPLVVVTFVFTHNYLLTKTHLSATSDYGNLTKFQYDYPIINSQIMKAIKKISLPLLLLVFSLCWVSNANAQNSKQEKKAKQEAEIKKLLDSQNYVFKAQTAFPLGARSRQLNYDYDLRITKEAVVSYLPYYGRAYSAAPGQSNGLDFTTKDFEYTIKENSKNDGWDITIRPKDTQQARELFLTAFKNGTANLQVTSNDKQNISFAGYITANKTKKK